MAVITTIDADSVPATMATDDEMGGEVGSNIEWSSSDADGEGGDIEEGVVIDGVLRKWTRYFG